MTAQNRKADAEEVSVFPQGKLREQSGDYALISIGHAAKWYKQKPIPENLERVSALPKGKKVVRQVENKFAFEDGSWVQLVVPEKITKTLFQMQKVKHSVLFSTKEALFVKYDYTKDTEWVLNINTPPPPPKKVSRRFTKEDERQLEFARANNT